MASFSVTEAATAGFGVIGRKPLAVVGWAVALVVGLLIPAALCFLAMGPEVARLMQLAMTQRTGAEPDPAALEQMMRAQSGMTAFNMLYWLWSSFVRAVFCAAVFRAVLSPGQSAWAYLRVGSREMWLTLLLLVEQVLAMIAVFVIVLMVAVLAAIAGLGGGSQSGPVAAIVTAVVGGFVAAGLLIWVALRLSMAAPMTFVDNQFRLFESWALTKGQGWRLLGVALLAVVFVLGLEILVGGVVFGVVVAGGSWATLQQTGGLEAFMARPPIALLRDLWPWLLSIGTIMALFGAVAQAIFYAPWAVAHRALTREA